MYPDPSPDESAESEEAARVREVVNARVREWTSIRTGGLDAQQVIMLRDMLVTHRLNLALSPWKESNSY
jgi:hypothetical protein